ncbi:hypothetical protein HDV00_008212 [Rhizophlyctis rosea]|nr:hypothetical protein HDV00_008212 [Rhizophlyctis rosea]
MSNPHNQPPLKPEVSNLLRERAIALYGDDMKLRFARDDMFSFHTHLFELSQRAIPSPSQPDPTEAITKLIYTYNFILVLDYAEERSIWAINKLLTESISSQNPLPVKWLNHMESILIPVIARQLAQSEHLLLLSPEHYAELRAQFLTFDKELRLLLPALVHKNLMGPPSGSALSRSLSYDLSTSLGSWILDEFFGNVHYKYFGNDRGYKPENRCKPALSGPRVGTTLAEDIPALISAGFRVKSAYVPWIVWRVGSWGIRDVGAPSELEEWFDPSAFWAAHRMLDQVVDRLTRCAKDEVREWEDQLRKALHVLEANLRRWKAVKVEVGRWDDIEVTDLDAGNWNKLYMARRVKESKRDAGLAVKHLRWWVWLFKRALLFV